MIRPSGTSTNSPSHRIVRAPARRVRQAGYDDLGVARCPICNAPLALRMARGGPVFICQCDRRRQKKAA